MAPSLGALEDTPENIWGTKPYNPETDRDLPTVFFGLYGFPDFYELWRHRGKKWVLWAGSDIRHFADGYHLTEGGNIKIQPERIAQYLATQCENWVENYVEANALLEFGVPTKITPSFLGKVENFEISYKPGKKVKLYTSVSGDNFNLYGWNKIHFLASEHPLIEFHLYGNTIPFVTSLPNVKDHGRVPKEQMNAEIKEMQGALRLTDFDGFSEIIAKSILMGQWPVSQIKYPYTLDVDHMGLIHHLKEPNKAGRDFYIKTLNKFPWVKK